jgi:hypothetical protein
MTPWDYISETLSQEPSMEEFKKGLGYLKDKGMDFLQATSMLSPETVAPLNRQAKDFASWVSESQVGKAVAQGAQAVQETGADYGMPAIGALWGPTNKFLKKLSPGHYYNLNSTDKKALEALTESYPSVKAANLQYGVEDAYGIKELRSLQEHLAGQKPGYILLTDPQNYTNHPLEKVLSSPAISYAHEGGHALTGGSSDIANWSKIPLMEGYPKAGVEGFAEGFSHALMGKYNKNVLAPYWQDYKKQFPDLKDAYLKPGYLGVDVGESIRGGNVPNQQNIIEELISILKGVS